MNQNFSDSSINSNCSRWNSAILRQYIVLFPSSRSLAIVLSYNEEVNLKVSLNIFLDSPFALVEITISLSVSQRYMFTFSKRRTTNVTSALKAYALFCFFNSFRRWLELAVFLPKKMQLVIRTFLLVKPIFFTNRLIARRSWFVFPLHTLSTPEFRPRTLRDIARFILVVNNMSYAIFRSEKLELLLHTLV